MLHNEMTIIRCFKNCQGQVGMNEIFLIQGLPVSYFNLRDHYVLEQNIICQISVKCITPLGAKFYLSHYIHLTAVRFLCKHSFWCSLCMDIFSYKKISLYNSFTAFKIFRALHIIQDTYMQKHIHKVFIFFSKLFFVSIAIIKLNILQISVKETFTYVNIQ